MFCQFKVIQFKGYNSLYIWFELFCWNKLILTDELLHYTFLEDIDCGGNDIIGGKTAATPEECAGICDDTVGCVAFNYHNIRRLKSNNCWCKNRCTNLTLIENLNTYIKGEICAEIISHKHLNYFKCKC